MKTTELARKTSSKRLAVLTAAALGASCAGLQAGSIGINFVNNGDGGIQNGSTDSLGSTEQAGAPGYEQVNWNNLGRWGGGDQMNDSTGAAAGVRMWWDSNNTWANGSVTTPDGKLMYGYLDSTGQINYDLGSYQFWWNENKPEVYVEGLAAWLAAQNAVDYDVVVYADGDATEGRKAEYWLQQSAGPGGNAPTSLGPDLTPHVFLSDNVNFDGTYTQVPLTANSVANVASGNYIVFPNVNSDNFILRTEERYYRAFLNGFQIVPHLTATAPSVVTDVPSLDRYSGGKAVFTVSAVGTPPLQYQWQKIGVGPIAGATNAVLALTNLSLSDHGSQYFVKISNTAGSVTSGTATLGVMDAANAKFTWSAPVTITTADEALNKPGVISGAASFGGKQEFVTNGGTVINFTSDGTVATTTGNGVYTDPNVFTIDTGNAQFNDILDYFSPDGGPKTITLNNLVPGLNYTVQLFSSDNRNISLGGRTAYYQDPNDDSDFSDTFANRDQCYVIASFKATSTTETIKMNLLYDNNGALNAAIVRLQQAAPAISINPNSMTVYRGQTVTLTSLGVGGAPLFYQWRKGGVAVTGETNASITLSNVASTAAYSVVVTNAAGSVTSTVATVTVIAAPAAGTFAAAAMANNPLALWRLNDDSASTNALDYASGINGYYGPAASWGAANGVQGPRPPNFTGFESSNSGLLCAGVADSYVTVPALNLYTNTLTVVAWINPSQPQAGYTGIVMSRDNVAAGMGFSGVANELAYTWNGDSTWTLHSGLIVPQNEWSMVALVIEPTQGTLYMANAEAGMVSAVNQIAHVAEKWVGQTRIGGDAVGAGRTFIGSIDEVAVFNHALTKEQLTTMWAAGRASGNLPPVIVQNPLPEKLYTGRPANFTVTATGSGTLSYQWKKNGSNLTDGSNVSGSTTATLTLGSVTTADNGAYSVDVANNAGSVTSDSVSLEVVAPSGKAFETAVFNANPLGFWRFDETTGTNAYDLFGGRTGFYYPYATIGQPGNTAGGFESDNYAFNTFSGQPGSYATIRPLNLFTNTVTVAAWISPAQDVEPASSGLFFQREGVTVSGLTYNAGGTNLSYTWNNDGNTYGWDSGLTIPSSQWVFVAMVIEAHKATLYMGTNGALVAAVHTLDHAVQPFDRTSYIGTDPTDANGTRSFNGLIDELLVAGRALSGEQIAQLYAAGSGVAIPPQINTQPTDATVYSGKPAQFSVVAAGSATLKYQWYKGATALTDSANVLGSTTPNLSIASATVADAGAYKVVVSNGSGNVTSTVVALNIGTVDGKPYESAVLAGNPVAYWRFNETSGTTAFDYVGGFNGTYGSAVTLGVPGPVAADMSGFEDANTAFQTTGVTNSYVTTPALNLNANTVTIVAWIYPTDVQPNWSGIVFTRGNDVGGLCFRDNQTELGYTWNNARYDWSSGIKAPLNQWSMVTLVISPTNALLYMGNASGVVSAENKNTHAVEGWSSSVRIGGDPSDSAGRTSKCIIDEVAIYNYSMADADVKNLYAQASTGGQPPSVTLIITQVGENIQLSWPNGTLQQADEITGSWTAVSGATSPYTVSPTESKRFYRVLVK